MTAKMMGVYPRTVKKYVRRFKFPDSRVCRSAQGRAEGERRTSISGQYLQFFTHLRVSTDLTGQHGAGRTSTR